MDGLTDDQRETIIPRHYCVAGYKNVFFYFIFIFFFFITFSTLKVENMKLTDKNVMKWMFSHWPCYKSSTSLTSLREAVSALPQANTAILRPIRLTSDLYYIVLCLNVNVYPFLHLA